MSAATTGKRQLSAAAMARIPEPHPRSRTERGRPPFQHAVKRDQAAKRRRVMSGAEGLGRIDFYGCTGHRPAHAVMAAMHEEAAGGDGGQVGL